MKKQILNSNTQAKINTTTGMSQKQAPQYEVIKLGIDWHAAQYRVVRIIDGSGPEPAQRFAPDRFLLWVAKQLTLAKQVYSCYESGAGGFVLHRQLTKMGVINYVIAARKLDRDQRGVQNDALDARDLAMDLDRYVRGNSKALRRVFVPTPEQEQRRHQVRQRNQLRAHRLSLAAQGRCLLLSQGYREANTWWKKNQWERLQQTLPAWLVERLEIHRRLIVVVEEELKTMTAAIEQCACPQRPKGMGALTLEQIEREVCDWSRFKNRKSIGSYAGLTGGVSASGDYHCDLPITKAGNVRLRTALIELAWRWVSYQHDCKLVQRWNKVFYGVGVHKRARKRAIIALARALFVDLWRWKTGRKKPEDLGWQMIPKPVSNN
jgi:transposase